MSNTIKLFESFQQNLKESDSTDLIKDVISKLKDILSNAEKFPQTKKDIRDIKNNFIKEVYDILDKEAKNKGEYVNFDNISRKYSIYFTKLLKDYNIRYEDGRKSDEHYSPDDDPKGGMRYSNF